MVNRHYNISRAARAQSPENSGHGARSQATCPRRTSIALSGTKIAFRRDRLTALCTELDQKTHAQIAVVTIDTLGGDSIDEYATSLFNRWGIGHKDDNRGILILLSLSDRKYRIEIGRGFEALFPNDRVARIGAEMIPDLKKQKYSEAVLHSTGMIASVIAKERGVKLTTVPATPL